MKPFQSLIALALPALCVIGNAPAQSSLDMLQKELDEVKSQHEQTASKNEAYFYSALQTAEESADAADKLYTEAGGKMPDRARVMTSYEHETPTEEAARNAVDQAAQTSFGTALQLHCGLMRFAALYATQPKLESLPADWLAWLKTAAQNYPQVAVTVTDPRHADSHDDANEGHDGRRGGGKKEATHQDVGAPIREMTMSESVIGKYLGFHSWGKAESGGWKVGDLPQFYYDQVLVPLEKTPSPATQAAWDVYIAMKQADEPDEDTWTEVDLPGLQFKKACDEYSAEPSTDKIDALVTFIKAHPDHPDVDKWIGTAHGFIADYQKQHGGAAPTSAAPAAAGATSFVPPDQPPAPAVRPTGQ